MKLSAQEITRVALFASLISIASLIVKIGGDMVVPFSILPFMVLLAGAVLGARLGALSAAVYVLVGLMGAPVFAKPPFGGLTYVLQPSFGFLPGFILAAYVTGLFLKGDVSHPLARYVAAALAGVVAYNMIGIPYLYIIVKVYFGNPFTFWKALQAGLFPFITLDVIKAAAAGVLARGVHIRLARQAAQGYEQHDRA